MARTWRHATAEGRTFDVCVVGAGITGAGVAREAALRGLSTLVLERRDVAFGTSSRSSRLVHGGVRYLEQGDLGLVYEALAERTILLRTAPGLVSPDRFLFAVHRGDRRPLWQLRLGLALYDVLSGFAGKSERLPAEDTRRREPLLSSPDLAGAVVYDDARTDDARLCLSVLQDARRHGAWVQTRREVHRLSRTREAWCIETDDGIVRARCVVVATGPFTDQRLLGPAGRGLVQRSKGVHLVFRHRDVPVRGPVVLEVPRRKRIVFVVPWANRTYVGTTDTPYEGDPDAVGVTRDDVAELLAVVRPRLPNARLVPEAIVGAYAGLRPLVRAGDTGDVADVSRTHRIVEPQPGCLAIVGGKLTTHRRMAEDVLVRVARHLGIPFRRGVSARRPLVPDASHLGPVSPFEAADLPARHGALAPLLAARARSDPALARPVVPDLPVLEVEIEHALAYEGCVHLDDLVRRRLPLALLDTRACLEAAPRLARRLVASAGRPPGDADAEVERLAEAITREVGAAIPGTRPTESGPISAP